MSTFDTSEIRRAAKRLAANSKKTMRELLQQAARGFVKDIIRYTPPASKGSTGAAAKKAGEAVIASDVMRIFEPHAQATYDRIAANSNRVSEVDFGHRGAKKIGVTYTYVMSFSEMAAFHKARRKQNGRVMGPKNGGRGQTNREAAFHVTTGLRRKDLRGLDVGLVSIGDFKKFIKLLQKRVGWLAAGWNPAARKLKVSLPAWVKRHSGAPGDIREEARPGRYRLTLENAVTFVEGIRGYDRRLQKVLDYQAGKLARQADFLQAKAMRKAGFR